MSLLRRTKRKARPSRKLLESRSPRSPTVVLEDDELVVRDCAPELPVLSPADEEASLDRELQQLRLAAKRKESANLKGSVSPLRLKSVNFDVSPAQLRNSGDVDAVEDLMGLSESNSGTYNQHQCNFSKNGAAGRAKSGRVDSVSNLFVVDVAWPHMYLGSRDITLINGDKQVSYNNLDMRLLTLGELEILALPSLSDLERQARSVLLKDILYYAGTYEWRDLLRLHSAVLTEVERGLRKWGDSTARLEQQILLQATKKGAQGGVLIQKADKNVKSDSAWYCWDFNYNTCNLPSPHKTSYQGREHLARHFCAKCFAVNRLKVEHAASSEQCPNRK